MNPYSIVREFEQKIADLTECEFAIAVDSGTSAVFLSLQYETIVLGQKGPVGLPKATHPCVANAVIHCQRKIRWIDRDWREFG